MKNLKKNLFFTIILVMGLSVFSSFSSAHPSVGTRSDHQTTARSNEKSETYIDRMTVVAVNRLFRAPVAKADVRIGDVELLVRQADQYEFDIHDIDDNNYCSYKYLSLSAQIRRINQAAHNLKRLVDEEASKFPGSTSLPGRPFYRLIRRVDTEIKTLELLLDKFGLSNDYSDDEWSDDDYEALGSSLNIVATVPRSNKVSRVNKTSRADAILGLTILGADAVLGADVVPGGDAGAG
jgi:hypothetical protein